MPTKRKTKKKDDDDDEWELEAPNRKRIHANDPLSEDEKPKKKKTSRSHRNDGNKAIIEQHIKSQIEELITYLWNKLKDRHNDYIDMDSLHRNVVNLDITEIQEENVQVG